MAPPTAARRGTTTFGCHRGGGEIPSRTTGMSARRRRVDRRRRSGPGSEGRAVASAGLSPLERTALASTLIGTAPTTACNLPEREAPRPNLAASAARDHTERGDHIVVRA